MRAVGDVRIARGVMYPVANLHADRIQDALLQVIQRRLFARRQLPLHDLTQNVVATGAILEHRPRFAERRTPDGVLVEVRRKRRPVVALEVDDILHQPGTEGEQVAEGDPALAWVLLPFGECLAGKLVKRRRSVHPRSWRQSPDPRTPWWRCAGG